MKKVALITTVGLKNKNNKPYVRALGGETFYTGTMEIKEGSYVLYEETETMEHPIKRNADGSVVMENGVIARNLEAPTVLNVQRRVIGVFETEEKAIEALNFNSNFQAKVELAGLKSKVAMQNELKELYAEFGVNTKADLLAQLL